MIFLRFLLYVQKYAVPLPPKYEKESSFIMTALELNAEIYRSLGVIAEDETMLQKVAKYVSKLAKQITSDPTLMTKEDFFARVDKAKEQAKRGEIYRFTDKSQMLDWLNSL